MNLCCPVRKAFLLYVDLDPTPGTFHSPGSAFENIQGILNLTMRLYTPVAGFVSVVNQDDKRRACFILYVDLDHMLDPSYSQESMRDALRDIFTHRIPHYNPMVSLAPDSIQPYNTKGHAKV